MIISHTALPPCGRWREKVISEVKSDLSSGEAWHQLVDCEHYRSLCIVDFLCCESERPHRNSKRATPSSSSSFIVSLHGAGRHSFLRSSIMVKGWARLCCQQRSLESVILGKYTSEMEFSEENIMTVLLFKKTWSCSCVRLELVWCIALLRADHSLLYFKTPVTKCLSERGIQLCSRMKCLCNIRCTHKQPQNDTKDNSSIDKWASSLCSPLHYVLLQPSGLQQWDQ